MLCDWIAASNRRGNAPSAPIERYREKGLSRQLECILRNTLATIIQTPKPVLEGLS